jgi:hypothetical protein
MGIEREGIGPRWSRTDRADGTEVRAEVRVLLASRIPLWCIMIKGCEGWL